MDAALQCDVASILPAYLRPAIPYEKFNRMQMECLKAWDSDSNLLISAPTGSGKTVCFELALLRQLHTVLAALPEKKLSSSGLSGKAVFIAPTKALCTERGDDWKNRYSFLGLRIEVITGDVSISSSDSKFLNADLIITTAEKWDSLTRNVGSQAHCDVMCQFSLLLLDEVHQLGDSRGAIFESVVTRMLVTSDELKRNLSSDTNTTPIRNLRVIAVSATVKNAKDVGMWLRVDPESIKQFDRSYRPVELEYNVLGYYIRNPWQSSAVYDNKMLDVLRKFGDGKPALVFCSSRRLTSLAAKALVAHLNRDTSDVATHGNALTSHLSPEQRRTLRTSAANCTDRTLAILLSSGVAVHNAELDPENRQLVESLFRDSLILCLFSTSTLAQGVNLPARLVVIAGTAIYRDGSLQEYDKNMLMQMCGRAGRPGLDTKGVAVIMTAKSSMRRYEHIQNESPSTIESQLESKLDESINAEIARQLVTDVPSAVFFLSNTFFWVREKKKLGLSEKIEEKMRTLLTSTVVRTINRLANIHLIRYDDDYFGVGSSSAGITMAKYCLSYETLRLMMTEVPKALSPARVLRIIASAPEVLDGVVVRRAEKKKLNAMNEFLRLPVPGKVKEAVDKVIILVQMVIGDNLETTHVDFALRSEALKLMQSVSRVCACLMSLVLEQSLNAPYDAMFSVLQVCRGLSNRCYWDGVTVLRQIPSVTPIKAKALAKQGITTIGKLAQTNFDIIDDLVSAKTVFGKAVLERLKGFPKFHLQTVAHRDSDAGGHISQIGIHVTISAQIGHRKPRQKAGERGFVLVGSHSIGVLDLKTFKLDDNNHQFLFSIPRENTQGKWIDVIVGSENVIGIDECTRYPLGKGKEGPVDSMTAQNCRSIPKKPLGQALRLSVTQGRVSKRFVQTKVPQTLGHFGTRGITSSFPPVVPKRTTNGQAIASVQPVLVKKPEPVSAASPDTSPDTSPGPSSPLTLPCEATDIIGMQPDTDSKKNSLGTNMTGGWHGRFEAFVAARTPKTQMYSGNINPIVSTHENNDVHRQTESISPIHAPAPDDASTEYDEMLKNLF